MIDWTKQKTEKSIEKYIKLLDKNSVRIDWFAISMCQILSEEFIDRHVNDVFWHSVSKYQKLSESFIAKHSSRVDWMEIFEFQKLSPMFIAVNAGNSSLYWTVISMFQKLNEKFIEAHADKVRWSVIFRCQSLSEEFIDKHKERWDNDSDRLSNRKAIIKYQKLSEEYKIKHNLKSPLDTLGFDDIKDCDSWLYASTKTKIDYIKKNTKYKIIDNKYIIAYKSVRSDNYSVYNFQYKYEVGKTYESHCDCNLFTDNSFGLSAWNKKQALRYHSKGKLLKVKINIEDIGAIVHSGNKIRCFKFEVVKEVKSFKTLFKAMFNKS